MPELAYIYGLADRQTLGIVADFHRGADYMDSLSPPAKVHKALIAPARHSDGPTLYLICQHEKTNAWEIHEHLPDGQCLVWTEPTVTGPQQAEAAIYNWSSQRPAERTREAVEQ